MKKLFSSKEIFKVKSHPIDPTKMPEPVTADEFARRGMAFYARQQFPEAKIDYLRSIDLDAQHLDAHYGLGMALKALGRDAEAVQTFSQAISIINNDLEGNSAKKDMLRRLALGHINVINQGDWNLEKEIWKRTD